MVVPQYGSRFPVLVPQYRSWLHDSTSHGSLLWYQNTGLLRTKAIKYGKLAYTHNMANYYTDLYLTFEYLLDYIIHH